MQIYMLSLSVGNLNLRARARWFSSAAFSDCDRGAINAHRRSSGDVQKISVVGNRRAVAAAVIAAAVCVPSLLPLLSSATMRTADVAKIAAAREQSAIGAPRACGGDTRRAADDADDAHSHTHTQCASARATAKARRSCGDGRARTRAFVHRRCATSDVLAARCVDSFARVWTSAARALTSYAQTRAATRPNVARARAFRWSRWSPV